MGLPEKIDTPAGKRTRGDTAQKRIMHRLDRHRAKAALHKQEEPASVDHKYQDYTT
jgi:hypothetical protein